MFYLCFLFISVVPVFVDVTTDAFGGAYHDWTIALFFVFSICVGTVAILVRIIAFFAQCLQIISSAPNTGALSAVGLAAQGAVFLFVTASWLVRLDFPWRKYMYGPISLYGIVSWYMDGGFVVVDNGVFALIQGGLFWQALWRGRDKAVDATDAERQPLLPRDTPDEDAHGEDAPREDA